MKNLALLLFLVVSPALLAQDFEGSITWDIKATIKDPQMKAQMEQAQKQMSDPATQKQMKEMQEQMSNPQFKAMMESNPQMKAQMERMMAMAQGGNVNDIIPKGMMVKIKSGNSHDRLFCCKRKATHRSKTDANTRKTARSCHRRIEIYIGVG